MSYMEYRTGIAEKIVVPSGLTPEEEIEFVKGQVEFPYEYCQFLRDEEDESYSYWNVDWYNPKTLQQVVRVKDGWYLIQNFNKKPYDDGYVEEGYWLDENKFGFTLVYYNGGTYFEEMLSDIIKKLEKKPKPEIEKMERTIALLQTTLLVALDRLRKTSLTFSMDKAQETESMGLEFGFGKRHIQVSVTKQ